MHILYKAMKRTHTNRHRTAARGSLGVAERNAVRGQIVALMLAGANPVRHPQGTFFQNTTQCWFA